MSDKVPRYTMYLNHCNGADMEVDQNGEFVLSEDYDKLAEDYAALQERYDLDVNPEGK